MSRIPLLPLIRSDGGHRQSTFNDEADHERWTNRQEQEAGNQGLDH